MEQFCFGQGSDVPAAAETCSFLFPLHFQFHFSSLHNLLFSASTLQLNNSVPDMERQTCRDMCDRMFESEEEEFAGQAEAWKYSLAFVESLAVKSVVLLGIPDIIARHGPNATLSLSQIAAELPSEKPDVDCLFRILRFLVAKNFFRAEVGVELKYGLTSVSKWFVKAGAQAPSVSMVATLLAQNDETTMAAWHHLSDCVLDGGVAFEKSHGRHYGDFMAAQPHHKDLFYQSWDCMNKIVIKAILSKYEGFKGLNSLVDVAGRTGADVAEIVKAYPSINGINYDLPHVIATAPQFHGVKNVDGDMLEAVPNGDAVFMKWILHDWSDEDSVKILKQCRKAIPESGKVIIVDIVLDAREKTELDPSVGFAYDLAKLAFTSHGGRDRSEEEWKKVLVEAGFPRYNFIAIPSLPYLIEAFPY